MAKPWVEERNELREQLLRAGVAPRHVRRYLRELTEHWDDLRLEQMRAGSTVREAEAEASARLGSPESLVEAMASQPRFRAWSIRAPWLVFAAGSVAALAAAYLVALTLLWTGWALYLPYSMTPFVRISGVSILWFGTGRLIYFAAPVLVGWAVVLVAARQRLNFGWPAAGLALLALIGGTAQVHVARWGGSWRSNRVSLKLNLSEFHGIARGHGTLPFQLLSPGLMHVALILALATLPYVLWRCRRALGIAA